MPDTDLALLQASEERWARFEAGDVEDKIAVFREAIAEGSWIEYEAVDMVNAIREDLGTSPEARARFDQLLLELKERAPDVYEESFGAFDDWLIEDAIDRGDFAAVPDLLAGLARKPGRYIDPFLTHCQHLLFHNELRPLLAAPRRAWPAIAKSGELTPWGIHEVAGYLADGEIFDYVTSAPAPRSDDPELRQRLDALPDLMAQEFLEYATYFLDGRASLDRFRGGVPGGRVSPLAVLPGSRPKRGETLTVLAGSVPRAGRGSAVRQPLHRYRLPWL